MSKYNFQVEGVSIEAVLNKLGGVEGAKAFLRSDVVITSEEDQGVVKMVLREDDHLYIDDKIVFLHKNEDGQEGVFLDEDIYERLLESPELFPEHWKRGLDEKTRLIYFFGALIFQGVGGLYPQKGQVVKSLYCHVLSWENDNLAADYCSVENTSLMYAE